LAGTTPSKTVTSSSSTADPPAGLETASQGGLEAHRVLGVPPSPPGTGPAPIIYERAQHRLAASHHRAMQTIARPQRPELGRLETAEHRGWTTVGATVEPETGESVTVGDSATFAGAAPFTDSVPRGERRLMVDAAWLRVGSERVHPRSDPDEHRSHSGP
jgi:hypothetical protein